MYEIVEHEGQFAVKSLFDDTLIKSKDSGKIIAFSKIEKAQRLHQVLMNNFNAIADASKYWFVKEVDSDNQYHIRRIEL